MHIANASPELRAAVGEVIASQMAEQLRVRNIDPKDQEACRAGLLASGFGALSVDALATRARVIVFEGV